MFIRLAMIEQGFRRAEDLSDEDIAALKAKVKEKLADRKELSEFVEAEGLAVSASFSRIAAQEEIGLDTEITEENFPKVLDYLREVFDAKDDGDAVESEGDEDE